MDKLEQCCRFAFSALDGNQGFFNEVLALILFVLIFIFLARWILKKLSDRFQKNKKYWHESFVRALFVPLNYYAIFFAIVHTIDLVGHHFFEIKPINDIHLLLKIGAIFAFVWFLLRWKKNLIKILVRKSKNQEISMEPAKLDVINKAGTILFLIAAFFMLLDATNSSLTTLIAFGGIGGLALAFASQEIISNFFAGGMLYMTQPFFVGDQIHLPEKNIEGHVEDIGWYMTLVRTLDKRPVYIPNSIFSKIVVITPSRMTHQLIKETFSLRYEDMPLINSIISDIKKMVSEEIQVDQSQKNAVYINTFATYSLDVLVIAYVKKLPSVAYYELRQEILLKVYKIIESHGAKAAAPTTYVEMRQP